MRSEGRSNVDMAHHNYHRGTALAECRVWTVMQKYCTFFSEAYECRRHECEYILTLLLDVNDDLLIVVIGGNEDDYYFSSIHR